MAISFEKFEQWCEDRFGDIKISGHEIKLNSIFAEDYKKHLWCSPRGGKHERADGVYHCWKTGKKGSLVSLVMQVDKCDYETAKEILSGENRAIKELESQLDEIFNKPQEIVEVKSSIELPSNTHLINKLSSDNYHRIESVLHLQARKIPTDGLYVCTEGDYGNRIIIPYYGKNGELIYYNGRYLGNRKDTVKYLGPPKEIGIGKGDVVYIPNGQWPNINSKIVIVEGEFDAMAIKLSGLNSSALGGKAFTEKQGVLLKNYIPIIGIDNDKAGRQALPHMGDIILSCGFPYVGYIRPPTKFKDWNQMFVEVGPAVLNNYIIKNEKKYDTWTGDSLRFKEV